MTDASRSVDPRTGKPMPRGGRLSKETIHARKVADAYRQFEDALPDLLVEVTKLVRDAGTTPGVRVQLVQSMEKLLALLPQPIKPDSDHMTALSVAAAMNRIAANPAKYIVTPVELETLRAGKDAVERETAELRAKIAELERVRREYFDAVERRPLPDTPKAPEAAAPPEVPGTPAIAPEVTPDLAPWVASLQADPPEDGA